jgi:hypothetical protein
MAQLFRHYRVFLVLVMLGIAYLDYATGKYLAVWGLYLIPITLASWMGGFRAGILLSVVSCVLIFVAGILGGNMFPGTGYFLLGIFNRFTAFFMVSWLASHLFRKQMIESTLESYEECMDYLHASPKKGVDPKPAVPSAPNSGPLHSPADQGH